MENNVYNVYCDESRVENPESSKMIIGALFIPRKDKKKLTKRIKDVFKKYGFDYELKWTDVHSKFVSFYKEIIDCFLSENKLSFRCIIVDKTKVNFREYHNNDKELAFFKFYYLMLRAKLLSNNKYYIFLDKKPTRDKNRARALHAYLDVYILWHKKNCTIEHFQAYNSSENILLQISDFITGLVAFEVNEHSQNSPKKNIADYLKQKLYLDSFLTSSSLSEEKFNRFVWDGDLCKK